MNEEKLTECVIYGWVQFQGQKLGAALKIGDFNPGKELTYTEILSHTSQAQLDKFVMETLPAPFRFVPAPGVPLFNIMTPEEYKAEFGDDDGEEGVD